jgi:hypothetical protein
MACTAFKQPSSYELGDKPFHSLNLWMGACCLFFAWWKWHRDNELEAGKMRKIGRDLTGRRIPMVWREDHGHLHDDKQAATNWQQQISVAS